MKILQRSRVKDTHYKCGTTLVDSGNEHLVKNPKAVLVVPADNSWYVVPPEESVIFLNSKGKCIHANF